MDALNAAAAVATVAALLFALWQHQQTRRKEATEQDRVAEQRERLEAVAATAASSAEVANLLVQRSKHGDVTLRELRGIARVLRADLALLARRLEKEQQELQDWRLGAIVSRPGSDEASTPREAAS